jgi:hypothetical protein
VQRGPRHLRMASKWWDCVLFVRYK